MSNAAWIIKRSSLSSLCTHFFLLAIELLFELINYIIETHKYNQKEWLRLDEVYFKRKS